MERMLGSDLVDVAERALTQNLPESRWPQTLKTAMRNGIAADQYHAGRFVLWLGMAITVATLSIDAVLIPDHLGQAVLIKIFPVMLLQALGLAMRPSAIVAQKLAIGLSLIVFSMGIAQIATWFPPPSDTRMLMGTALLLGLAQSTLPFSPRELALFVVTYVLALAATVLSGPTTLQAAWDYLAILAIIGLGAWLLSVRLWRLKARNFLLNFHVCQMNEHLQHTNVELIELSKHDPLTGLANRRHCTEMFQRQFADAAGDGRPTVLMIDLDRFKNFNDRWGHQAGDNCLCAVAEVLRHHADRARGIAARFGGEEFVVILLADDERHALSVAEMLRVAIERIEIALKDGVDTATLTTSVGVAVHPLREGEPPNLSSLLSRADSALYRAKRGGRNRSELAEG